MELLSKLVQRAGTDGWMTEQGEGGDVGEELGSVDGRKRKQKKRESFRLRAFDLSPKLCRVLEP